MIVSMKKVHLIGLEAEKAKIVDDVMKAGSLHLENLLDEDTTALLRGEGGLFWTEKLDAQLRRLKDAIEFVRPFDTAKKPMFAQKRVLSQEEFRAVAQRQEDIIKAVDRVLRLKSSMHNVESLRNRLETEIASMLPWEPYDISMDIRGTRHSRILLGTVPAASDLAALEEALETQVGGYVLSVVGQDKLQYYLAVLVHEAFASAAEEVLLPFGFSAMELSPYHGTVRAYIEEMRKDIFDLEEQRQGLLMIVQELLENLPDFESLFDYLTYRHDTMEVVERANGTDATFVLSGYVPEERVQAFAEKLEKKYTVCVTVEDVPEGEEFPVMLDNPGIVKPFEVVTELFSMPSSLSFDPNAVMAIFYFIFFGMMISDAGYGIVLALITGLFLWRVKPTGMMKQMFQLLFWGGISTIFWGAMFGGWFGDVVSAVTGGAVNIPAVWFNPLDDPIQLLIVSLLLGGVHLLAGLGLNAYKLIRRGKIWDAIFDVGSWYLVLIGLGILALSFLFLPAAAQTVGMYMAIAGGVMLLLTQGRQEKNIFKKFFKGLLSLYDITSYLSDILSYSRLLALGLATGVIAMVVNTMSTMVGWNVLGFIILVLGLLIGHVFNIAINTLGAFVHASRLQYVEFFGKFFEGGGVKYRPLQIKSKYVNVKNK